MHAIPQENILSLSEIEFVLSISNTFNVLASQTDFSPSNPIINETLSKLVGSILEAHKKIQNVEGVLHDPALQRVREPLLDILSSAEFEMESYFASHFNSRASLDLKDLNDFWYRENYQDLVGIELDGIKKYAGGDSLSDGRPIAFIGSGPLPLSAVDYYLQTGKSCDCIELDPAAAAKSAQMIEKLGLSSVIRITAADGRDVDYSKYGIIFVAALVNNKNEVLDRIHSTAKNSVVGIRSADGLRELLYRAVDISDVKKQGYVHIGTAVGNDDVINSTCFFTPSLKVIEPTYI